jgi:NADPH:quinone reductase-like Zn-dependent oxidoreductase
MDALHGNAPEVSICGVNGLLSGQRHPNDSKWMGPLGRLVSARVMSWFMSQPLGVTLASTNAADLEALADLTASGKVTPTIDRQFPLAGAPAAIHYVEEGRARHKVVISVK